MMAKRRRKSTWKRHLSCVACGREIVVYKGHWQCPHCHADNRVPDWRGKGSLFADTATAIPLGQFSDKALAKAIKYGRA